MDYQYILDSFFNGQHIQFRGQLRNLTMQERYECYLFVEEMADNNIYSDILREIAKVCITRQF